MDSGKKRRRSRDASNIYSGKKLLDKQRLCDFLSISEAALDRLVHDPDEKFPLPIDLLRGKRLWVLEAVERYVQRKQDAAAVHDRR